MRWLTFVIFRRYFEAYMIVFSYIYRMVQFVSLKMEVIGNYRWSTIKISKWHLRLNMGVDENFKGMYHPPFYGIRYLNLKTFAHSIYF